MKKNLALVTGTTSGLGYSAAKQLVQDGWSHVIVTGRSQPRVDEAVNRLKTETGTQNITGIALDLRFLCQREEGGRRASKARRTHRFSPS